MNRGAESLSESGLAVVIMAAGRGTRLKSKRPKVLHEVGGMPLLAHVIRAATAMVAPQHVYVVIGHEAERVREAVAASGVRFVLQAEQRGTGHAIQCAEQAVAGYANILVLSGDVPLIRPETIAQVREYIRNKEIVLEKITNELFKAWPSTGAADKKSPGPITR